MWLGEIPAHFVFAVLHFRKSLVKDLVRNFWEVAGERPSAIFSVCFMAFVRRRLSALDSSSIEFRPLRGIGDFSEGLE